MGSMKQAMVQAGWHRAKLPTLERKLQGTVTPAFVGMVTMLHSETTVGNLVLWHAKTGKLWTAWQKLNADAKAAVVRVGRRALNSFNYELTGCGL